jgi:hypothetical protein
MLSSSRIMITAIFTCCCVVGCSSDMLDPVAGDHVSARIASTMNVSASAVAVSVTDSSIAIGDTVRLSAVTAARASGRTGTRDLRVTYASSSPNVASVDRRGLITALANGTAIISAKNALGTGSVTITVGVTSVALDTATLVQLPDLRAAPPAPEPLPPAPQDDAGVPVINMPMLPAATVDIRMPTVTGRSIRVAPGDEAALQAALNSAVGGDEVVLPNGSVYTGTFTLPKHSGTTPVIVRSETVSTPVGTRVTPSSGSTYARIITNTVFPAINLAPGASKWRLIGLHVGLTVGPDNYGIITLGSGTESLMSQFVSEIVLDRMIVTAGAEGTTSRCISMNGNSLAVIDSWLADCHAKGRDTQGILGWTGMGPHLIQNNHIEGAGQAVMFGGGDPRIADLTPSDITIRGNYLYKPMSWANGKWTVKATFELKHARRLLFEGNVLENHWIDAQVGFAILLSSANQSGTAPWSKVQDITLRNNIIKNSTSGMNIFSRYTTPGHTQDEPSRRILARNNLFVNVGNDPVSGATSGVFLQLLGDHEDVSVMQNTFIGPRAQNAVMFSGAASKRLTLFNNAFGDSQYGLFGSGTGEGTSALTMYTTGIQMSGNVFTGRMNHLYPAGNSFPATLAPSDFTNAATGDYTLRSTLPFATSGGTIVGVYGPTLQAAVQRSIVR